MSNSGARTTEGSILRPTRGWVLRWAAAVVFVAGSWSHLVGCQDKAAPQGAPTPRPDPRVSSAEPPASAPAPTVAPAASAPVPVDAGPPAPFVATPKRTDPIVAPVATAPHVGWPGPVQPEADVAWLARLTRGTIHLVKANAGGSSVTLRVRFEDGARALFKPEQKKWRTGFRGEIGAYHVDRLLGFGRVAVVAGRVLDHALLRAHLVHSGADTAWLARFDEEVMAHSGGVAGALIAWHARPLVSDPPPSDFTDALDTSAPLRKHIAERLPEWSDMLVFDHLIHNTDRWSGGNVLTLGRGGPVVFLDQAAGFNPWRPDTKMNRRLAATCRFRRATVNAIRARRGRETLSSRLADSLAHDPLAPVLGARAGQDLEARLITLADHMDACEEKLGSAMTSFEVQEPAAAQGQADAAPAVQDSG